MYRRPKFLEVLLEIRAEMAREADYDACRLVETIRTGGGPAARKRRSISRVAKPDAVPDEVNSAGLIRSVDS